MLAFLASLASFLQHLLLMQMAFLGSHLQILLILMKPGRRYHYIRVLHDEVVPRAHIQL